MQNLMRMNSANLKKNFQKNKTFNKTFFEIIKDHDFNMEEMKVPVKLIRTPEKLER